MTETRSCQNCTQNFTVEPGDFDFYAKMEVPAPTFCPQCRLQRRLAHRNERSLYKGVCGLCKQNILTMYDPAGPIISYCGNCWWSDKWDSAQYGQDYDFSRPFFEQFKEFAQKVPHQNLLGIHKTWVNSGFSNMAHELKNCYWLFNSDYDENCLYVEEVERSKECVDATMIDSSEFIYASLNCKKCYKIYYSFSCESSHDLWFCKDMVGSSSCFGCVGLRNKQYCIFNKQFTKTEYEEEIKKFDISSHFGVEATKKKVSDFWLTFPNKYFHGTQNTASSGDYVDHSRNVQDSYIVTESENCRYCMWLIAGGNKDCHDFTQFGENAQNLYETLCAGKGANNMIGGIIAIEGHSLRYSALCFGSWANLFGCVGIRGKKYCIFNKQYTKEEYEALLPKIIQHMSDMPYVDAKGRKYVYGDFYPVELSDFAYNETSAQEFFPLTKEQAEAAGFSWKSSKEKDYKITMLPEQLPDKSRDINDTITREIIGCSHGGSCNHQCTTAFRVVPAELQFYRRFAIPLPRLCPNCRHHDRLSFRNPPKLWDRQCAKCQVAVKTSYEPERPDIVYCEPCYQAEVV